MNVLTIILIQTVTFLIQAIVCDYDRRVLTTTKYSKYSITPAVVNGKPVKDGEFPFLVSLKEPLHSLEPDKVVWGNLCGGSIIASERVLTAAHCFEQQDFFYAKTPTILRVVAGSMRTDLLHDENTETTAEVQWRKIKSVVLHQYFAFPTNDIALVMVNEPWVFNKKVNYVRLASRTIDYEGRCIAAGFGKLGFKADDKVSPIMLRAEIVYLPRSRCSSLWEMNMDSHICTSSSITDVANGDSGGPLLCSNTGDAQEMEGHGILAGIVSAKNFDATTLYTRVSVYRTWILSDGKETGWIRHGHGRGDKLHGSMNVCWSIILFVLIYHLFYQFLT